MASAGGHGEIESSDAPSSYLRPLWRQSRLVVPSATCGVLQQQAFSSVHIEPFGDGLSSRKRASISSLRAINSKVFLSLFCFSAGGDCHGSELRDNYAAKAIVNNVSWLIAEAATLIVSSSIVRYIGIAKSIPVSVSAMLYSLSR